MTTYEEIGLLTELYENKDRYIEMSGNDERIIELYDQLILSQFAVLYKTAKLIRFNI